MEKIQHKMVAVNDINMHVAELGNGPTILFIHGFPELWYTWRHQIVYLASHGYHAVAPDLRGYGDTTGAPVSDPTKFTTLHVVGDLVALINTVAAPGENKVFVVGHDWGAMIAWGLCLYRPDKVKALVNMSVPFGPRNPKFKPIDGLGALYGKDYYIIRFQEPGEIEGELTELGTDRVLNEFFSYRKPAPLFLPKGSGFGTSPDDPIILPPFMSKEDLEFYTSKFEKTGFTGGLNYYRALNFIHKRKKKMEGIVHKTISVNGLDIHIAEKGEGPLVLFVHGFPELWYSWRHQILYLADHGYRAVAPDLRGYGDTTGAPVNDPTKFTIYNLVGDLIGLLDAITSEGEKVFVVGHDWGAFIAWHLCLFRPDRVKALVNLSVPFFPWNPMGDVIELMRAAYGEDHYMVRFQVPGEIEAELAGMDSKTIMKKFLTFREPGPIYFPKGKGFKHSPGDVPVTLPPWLTEEDVEYFASKLDKTGISGGVNYYRVLRLNWELTAVWSGAKVRVPSKFITGDLDLVYHMPGIKDYIHNGAFKNDVPYLEEVVVMEGAAHFINQEKPDEINKHIFDYLQKF